MIPLISFVPMCGIFFGTLKLKIFYLCRGAGGKPLKYYFYSTKHESVPHLIVNVMSTLEAWRAWTGSTVGCGSYGHRERREIHFLWPQGHLIEDLLQERIHGSDAVAPDGSCTGDVCD